MTEEMSEVLDLPVTHIMIPDTQAKLDVPTDHLGWIGQFIVDEYHNKNIKIIHIGDHADMPSLSHWDAGKKKMEGRRYQDDLDSANEAWRILNQPFYDFNANRRRTKTKIWNPERYITLGNHEDRIKVNPVAIEIHNDVVRGAINYVQIIIRQYYLLFIDMDGITYVFLFFFCSYSYHIK